MFQRIKHFALNFYSHVLQVAYVELRYVWRFFVRPNVIKNSGIYLQTRHPAISRFMRNVMYRGEYETPELQILEKTLESGDRVLELGGGAGFISTFVAQTCGSDNVTVVEANPALAPLIAANHRLNGVAPRVINAAATHDNRATETFYIANNFWSGSTSAKNSKQVTVPAINVNTLIAEYDPTYLIIDIEGAETAIIPMLDMRGVRKLLIELHPQFSSLTAANEVILHLFRKGFVIDFRRLIRNQIYFVRADDEGIFRQKDGMWTPGQTDAKTSLGA